jgi:hypothetical protein
MKNLKKGVTEFTLFQLSTELHSKVWSIKTTEEGKNMFKQLLRKKSLKFQ